MTDHYSLTTGTRAERPNSRRRIWLIIVLVGILLLVWAIFDYAKGLKPKTTITQSKAVTSKVAYDTKTTHYSETDFSIDLPSTWKLLPRPLGEYQSYTWSSGDTGSDEQEIEIYEDTIPVNFAVNKVLILEGEVDHVQIDGTASDECNTFTNNVGGQDSQTGVPAKWQNVSFLCDRLNQERDTIGTSSTDGVNTVILQNQSTGQKHKFFFTYTDQSLSPDYAVFYAALQSFKMQ